MRVLLVLQELQKFLLVTGRGGAKIKELEESSGSRIQVLCVLQELGYRLSHRVIGWFGLEGVFKIMQFQPLL